MYSNGFVFYDSSTWVKRCLVVLALGMTCHVISVVSPYWVLLEEVHAGIWQVCTDELGCTSISDGKTLTEHWLRGVQALVVIAVLVSLFSVVTSAVHLRNMTRYLLTVGAISAIGSGILALLAAALYGVYNGGSTGLSWAFMLEAIAGGIILTAGVALLRGLCRLQ